MARINLSGAGSESHEQRTLVAWWQAVRRQWPGAVLFAIPNGGARSAVTGARLRAEGVVAGIPDLFLAAPRGSSHGLFIEMKRTHGGRVDRAQEAAMALLESQGYECAVCRGFEAARGRIEAYMAKEAPRA
jgi:hypothetical protein